MGLPWGGLGFCFCDGVGGVEKGGFEGELGGYWLLGSGIV